jgi:hypothetical protein
MTILSDSVLIESKSARENQLRNVSHDRALEILSLFCHSPEFSSRKKID